MKKIFSACSLLAAIPLFASAHVAYLIGDTRANPNTGADIRFLLEPLKDPFYIALMIGAVALGVLLYTLICRMKVCQDYFASIEKRMETYLPLLPWMARIAVGIMLIGAGVSGNLISPAMGGFPYYASIQILLGFLILTGFFLFPAVIAGMALFLFALGQDFYLIGNIDIFALLASVLLFADARPGVDDLFKINVLGLHTLRPHMASFVVRIGFGISMMFLAIYEKLLNPHLSELIVRQFNLTSAIPVSPAMWVLSTGIIEFLVGLAIFIGFQTRLCSALAFVVLTASFFYFGETVYSHVTLFAALSMIFVTGGGLWSVDAWFKNINTQSRT